MLRPEGVIITLVKPHYEATKEWLRGGILPAGRLKEVLATCRADIADLGWEIVREIESPLPGHGGSIGRLWLLRGRAEPG